MNVQCFSRLPQFRALLALIFTLSFSTTAGAIGIVVPRVPDAPAPQLQSVLVDTEIKDHIAKTRFTQVFKNAHSRPVEADFYFPVPDGADITDFVLYMDGKPVKGEVLDKDKAHDIYRDIVRKMKDPGLVEWAEKNLFRVRIFPIPANGEQKLEIEISQPLTADQGYFRYALPLEKTKHHKTASPLVSFRVNLEATQPIRNVYSPTHQIDISTSDSTKMIVTASAPISDSHSFLLYYEPSDKDIAASLLTHRPKGDDDGYFSLRISPPWNETTTTTQQGQYVFVVDTSGSMAETDKMQQARKALKYCVNLLKDHDSFNIVRFSTTADVYQPKLLNATADNRKNAAEWIETLEARGGTNISDALKRALAMRSEAATTPTAEAMFTVIFITDGLPTVGQTSPDAIIKAVEEQSEGNIRIFTFGVGNDVNTRLLDRLAEETRAASDYVAPEADLEVPVSRFFDKINRPALFNVELQIPAAGVKEIFPPQLPDLFYGTELAVYGKYSTATTSPVILKGTIGGKPMEFLYEKNFSSTSAENSFLEKLWATRKVAWLLDQVRTAGESSELRTEIEELAKKYSIVTPYTSYLAMEDEPVPAHRTRHVQSSGGSRPLPPARPQATQFGWSAADKAVERQESVPAAANVLQRESGADAVYTARRLSAMKSADSLHTDGHKSTVRKYVQGKTFEQENSTWKDTSITGQEQTVIKIIYLSEAWFQLTEEFPEIRDFFALGEKVHILLGKNIVLQSGPEGIDSIDVATRNVIAETLIDKK